MLSFVRVGITPILHIDPIYILNSLDFFFKHVFPAANYFIASLSLFFRMSCASLYTPRLLLVLSYAPCTCFTGINFLRSLFFAKPIITINKHFMQDVTIAGLHILHIYRYITYVITYTSSRTLYTVYPSKIYLLHK